MTNPKTTKSKPTPKVAKKSSKNYILAKSDDGTIQITYTIPIAEIKKTQETVAEELGKDIEVPGFRKGNAPLAKLIEHIPHDTLAQNTLNKILPMMFSDSIQKEGVKPATYPKFELISAEPDSDWQVRATTCEIPEIDLGDYKKQIKSLSSAQEIWTPDKGSPEDKPKEPTRAEKETKVIQTLIESIKVTVPRVLIEEEANAKLSQLLERLEKLSLNLDSYLASVGKNPQTLRQEYELQAKNALALDLILNEVADKEEIKVPKSQVDEAIKNISVDTNQTNLDTPEQRRLIESIIRRKMALDSLVNLI